MQARQLVHLCGKMFAFSSSNLSCRHASHCLQGSRQWTVARAEGSSSGHSFSSAREVIRTDGRLDTSTATTTLTAHTSTATTAPAHDSTTHTPHKHAGHPSGHGPHIPDTSQRHNRPQAHSHTAPKGPAPVAEPITDEQLEFLVDHVTQAHNVLVITGAGISTESGIPDYRGPQGAYTKHGFKPMTHQQFMAGPAQRARYFARSFFGWHTFAAAQPGGAHAGLARLVAGGWVSNIITQNVDRLHHKAGTPADRVLELHGTTHEVQCLDCGTMTNRADVQARLAQLNPAAAAAAERTLRTAGSSSNSASTSSSGGAPSAAVTAGGSSMAGSTTGSEAASGSSQLGVKPNDRPSQGTSPMQVPVMRPDGDVELQDAGVGFVVPPCDMCGGTLKPHVVFFGDNIPKDRTQRSLDLARSADLVLVVGSSLMVYSAYRLVEAAAQRGAAVILLNVGPTRADPIATAKLPVLAGEALMRLATHPRLLLPRI